VTAGPSIIGEPSVAQDFKESRHLFAFAVRGRFDAAAPGSRK